MRSLTLASMLAAVLFACVTAAFPAESASAPAPAAARPAIEKVEMADGALRVNGKPFFPLMGFYQSTKSFANAAAAGLNGYFYPGDKPAAKEYLDALKEKGLYGMVRFDANAAGHPALLAWLLPHEPDAAFLNGKDDMSPAAMLAGHEQMKKADPTRPVVLDWSPAFTSIPEESNVPADKKREIYPAYAKAADILTYNVYPIWGFNRPDCIDWPAKAASDLLGFAPKKPFFAMIETGKGSRDIPEANQIDVTPDDIRAEVWMAICGGAKGIIYFTHQFKPKFSEFGPDAARQAAIRKINEQITRLAPAILAPAATTGHALVVQNGVTAYVKKTTCEGDLYVFVLNGDVLRRGGTGTLTLKGIADGTKVEVVDEGRALEVKGGAIADDFPPLALHVYKMKAGK